MIGLIEKLVGLDITLPHELSVDLLLLSLPAAFDPFVVNFNMNKLEATLEEVVNILVVFEGNIKKDKPVLLMGSSSSCWGTVTDPDPVSRRGNGRIKLGRETSTTGRDTPSSACTRRPDEIGTDGNSSKSWPEQIPARGDGDGSGDLGEEGGVWF
ncbi:Retrotransposon protein [Dorcoceras hygrometricum]|uniref:Retrotransposon protein n=1 Tax=Dorcoceras hygrometricum TaxID=472368 RepID=A0A2Z7BJ27_9LAMI|nr:Retrotransposon protein [Dorcoceras hygrometricum]